MKKIDFGEKFLEKKIGKKERNIHSYLHELTREVANYVGEPKKFGLWLGVIKNAGEGKTKDVLARMKERNIASPKYLIACLKKKI